MQQHGIFPINLSAMEQRDEEMGYMKEFCMIAPIRFGDSQGMLKMRPSGVCALGEMLNGVPLNSNYRGQNASFQRISP